MRRYRVLEQGLTACLMMFVAGCATTAPPEKAVGEPLQERPIQDLRSVAGNWNGFIRLDPLGRTFPLRMTIKEDGSYQAYSSYASGGADVMIDGTMQLANGKIVTQSSMGHSSTVTLYEGQGKRVLKFVRADGASGEIEPAK